MIKFIFLPCVVFLVFVFFVDVSHAMVVSGVIDRDTVWAKDVGPYVIEGEVIVADGALLTIEPGTAVIVDGERAGIRVLGGLVARASGSSWTTFTSFVSASNTFISAEGGFIDLHQVMTEGVDEVSASAGGFVGMERVAVLAGSVRIDSSSARINRSRLSADGATSTIFVASTVATSSVFVGNSTIGASHGLAVDSDESSVVRLPFNFWGDPSGPRHAVLNPDGLGFEVRGEVSFSPWLIGDETVPWSELCCSNVMFIPGVKASRLYGVIDGEETRLWEPVGDSDVRRLALGGEDSVESYVRVDDVIREAYPGILGSDIYKSVTDDFDALVHEGLIREWLPVAYDWRLDLGVLLSGGSLDGARLSYTESSENPYIMAEFARLAEASKTGRVTIVAHSNGGLLAKALVARLVEEGKGELVDKIILVGSPQAGTPQAIGSVFHGFGEGIFPFSSKTSMMEASRTMPASYNLFPSTAYVPEEGIPLVVLSGTSSSVAVSSGAGLFDFISSGGLLGGAPVWTQGDFPVSLELLERAGRTHVPLDSWAPPPYAKLVQIVGTGLDTLAGLEYQIKSRNGLPVLRYKPLITSRGDGVVTVGSASVVDRASNVRTTYVNLARGLLSDHSHADMFEDDMVKSIVMDEVRLSPFVDSSSGLESSEPVLQDHAPGSLGDRLRIYLYSDEGEASLRVTDSLGNRSGAVSLGAIEQIPHSQYRSYGNVSYMSLPCASCSGYTGPFEILVSSLSSSTDPIELEVDLMSGGVVTGSSSSGYVTLVDGYGSVSVGEDPSAIDFSSFGSRADSQTEEGNDVVDGELSGPVVPDADSVVANAQGSAVAPIRAGGSRMRNIVAPADLGHATSFVGSDTPVEPESLPEVVGLYVPVEHVERESNETLPDDSLDFPADDVGDAKFDVLASVYAGHKPIDFAYVVAATALFFAVLLLVSLLAK